MKRRDVINHVLDQVWRVRTPWLAESTGPMKRMQALVACVFRGFEMISMTPPDVDYNPNMYATTGDSGLYKGTKWTLELDPTFASAEKVREQGDLALRECLDTVYHEARHHEQHMHARWYWLTLGEASANFKKNLPIYKENNMPLTRGLNENFGIPPKYAEGLAKMIMARPRYEGSELEQIKKWYEECFGSFSSDKSSIMTALRTQSKGRDSIYSMYRTIFMEDDGWETGYLCGDLYLARSFNEKKASKEKTIRDGERKLQLLKEAQETKKLNLVQVYNKVKGAGGGQAKLNLIKQKHAELKLDDAKIQMYENAINGEKLKLGKEKGGVQSLLKRHRESMTEHRLKAYGARQRHGLYQGTAVPR